MTPGTMTPGTMTPGLMVSLYAATVAFSGCKKPAPDVAPAATPVPVAVEVKNDAGWIFTYAADDGRFESATEPDKVPEGARPIVRAVNPAVESGKRVDTNDVLVIDLRDLLKGGAARAQPMAREVFETRALAGLPPGESSLLSAGPGTARIPAPGDGGTTAASGNALVTLYGTSWCGACQSARRYFIDKRIPFVDKDIERDAAAAAELREKAARFGIAADRVPVLDVRGRLLIGFDPSRVERILGETAI